jgi:Histidine phosphatase superfamily (branch 1)
MLQVGADYMEQRWPERLWIVRHGQSAGNVARDSAHAAGSHRIDIDTRDVDVPLSELGERQALALGRWFASHPELLRPDVVTSSTIVRVGRLPGPQRRFAELRPIGLRRIEDGIWGVMLCINPAGQNGVTRRPGQCYRRLADQVGYHNCSHSAPGRHHPGRDHLGEVGDIIPEGWACSPGTRVLSGNIAESGRRRTL